MYVFSSIYIFWFIHIKFLEQVFPLSCCNAFGKCKYKKLNTYNKNRINLKGEWGKFMIGDDDFFMQNADYHYGASDAEKIQEETMMILILEATIQEVMEEMDQVDKMLAPKMTTAENIALQEF